MPRFTSLAAADAWRAVHAPLRKRPETSPKKGAEVGKKNARASSSTTEQPEKQNATGKFTLPGDASNDPTAAAARAAAAKALGVNPGEPPPERIDIEKFVDKQGDFSSTMIEHAKEVPQIAHGLLRRAMTSGEPGAIAAASKNWHEASGHAADVLERFLKIQKETGNLLSLADVDDVVMTELQEVRKNLKRLGARHAAAANPVDPELAVRIFNEAVDLALEPGEGVPDRVRLELAVVGDEARPAT